MSLQRGGDQDEVVRACRTHVSGGDSLPTRAPARWVRDLGSQHGVAPTRTALGVSRATGPKIVVSNSESMELVGVLSGAIVLMDANDVPAGLKVPQVDKLRPGDKGYPLKPVPTSE